MKLKPSRKSVRSILVPVALLLAASVSHASIIVTSRADMSAGSQTLLAPGPDGNLFDGPVAINYSGGIANIAGPDDFMQRVTQGSTWAGNFSSGDALFFTSFTPGAISVTFSSDITEVGTQYQPNFYGPFTGTIRTFDATNTLIGSFSLSGISGDVADGSAPFLGIRNTGSDNAIRRVEFASTHDDSGFAINGITFGTAAANTAPVPEPETWAMLGLGLLALAAYARRRKTTVTSPS